MEAVKNLVVGVPVIYKGDMANASGNGAIVAVRKSAGSGGRTFSMNFATGKLEPFDDSVSVDIALDDGRLFPAVYVSNIGGEFSNKACRFMLDPMEGNVGPEGVAALLAGVEIKKAADKAAADEKAARFAAAKAEAIAAGKKLGLIPAAEFNKRGKASVWNLRAELKAAGIKARVVDGGGSSIDVYLEREEDRAAANAIACKYKAGNFDGMTDCYEYRANPWGDSFGSACYVFVQAGGGYL